MPSEFLAFLPWCMVSKAFMKSTMAIIAGRLIALSLMLYSFEPKHWPFLSPFHCLSGNLKTLKVTKPDVFFGVIHMCHLRMYMLTWQVGYRYFSIVVADMTWYWAGTV